jgi:peptide/nickel transport system substrate-binding protein
MTRTHRRLLAAALICGVGAPAATAAALRYAEDLSPAIVNPLFATTMSEARVNELLFQGLYTDDTELSATPALASSVAVDSDRMGMTVTLRQGMKWHDGEPVTADDVLFTIQAMKNPDTLSTESGRVEWISEATKVDDYTVELEFEHIEARPEDKLYFKILPEHLFDSTTVTRSDTFRNRPVGTGPYVLTRYNDDNSIALSANPTYPGGVGITELVMREISDKNYQAKLLLYESLEALIRVLPRDLAVLQNNRKVELYPYQTNSWWYVGFNLDRAPFDDADVRKAIANLIDVENLLAPVGTGDILTGPFVKSSPFYNHDVTAWGYNYGTASALLEKAGFKREGEFWVDEKGEPLTINLNAHQTLQSSQEVVINLQAQLQGSGVKVNVDFLDEAAWKGRVWREREFDVVLSQWSFDRNEDIYEQFHSKGSRNFLGYTSDEVDEQLDAARTAVEPHAKKTALRNVHALVHEDVPMVFLWTLDSYAAMSTRVSNVLIHPFYFFTYVDDWRLQ